MSEKIRAIGISKVFYDEGAGKKVEAIEDITLSIDEGHFVVIIGPSGCGKSTFLNIVAGFEKPTKGEVFLNGEPIVGPGPDRGFVFQEFVLYPWRTVLGNVTIGLEVQKMPKTQRTKLALELLKLIGLQGFEYHYPHVLSGGMKQRVAIARSLATDPEILLMDEPFGALDAQTRQVFMQDLLRIWEKMRKTILFVTHSTQEAILLADEIIILSARPSSVCKIVTVSLPRPRDPLRPEFIELEREVLQKVSEEGDRMMQRSRNIL